MGGLQNIGIGEVVGIGVVALGILSVGYKVLRIVVQVIERNARAMEKLSNNVGENTVATRELRDQSHSTKNAVDNFSNLLIQSQKK